MDIFKQRLKEFSIMAVFCVVSIALCFIPYGLLLLTGYIHEDLPGILASLFVLGLIGFWVVKFLYWLFVEPFRKTKGGKFE